MTLITRNNLHMSVHYSSANDYTVLQVQCSNSRASTIWISTNVYWNTRV